MRESRGDRRHPSAAPCSPRCSSRTGDVVTADALLDALWGEEPARVGGGHARRATSRGCGDRSSPIAIAKAPAKLLCWDPPGYRLATDGHDVDFRSFEHLADEGRRELVGGDPQAARDILLEADRLWRGPALVEFADREFAAGLATRLEERRVAAIEDRVAADLALGRHAALAGELTELVGLYPLREALRGAAGARPLPIRPAGGRAASHRGRAPHPARRTRRRSRTRAPRDRVGDPRSRSCASMPPSWPSLLLVRLRRVASAP